MTNEELKPCPFCGCEDKLVIESLGDNDWFVECDNCRMSLHAYHQTKESALNKDGFEWVDDTLSPKQEGWNDCIDHLSSKGYLRTPPDNSEALDRLDKFLNDIHLESYRKGKKIIKDYKAIRAALGDNDE